jgi:ATP-dependent protease HslVU (ClpYQ) peptidase subunit
MTCIVGVEKDGTVWLGGDRAATDGRLNKTIIKDPKVFMKGEVGFGVCGSPKVMDALAHGIELPVQESGTDRAFLVSTLVPAIREGLVKLDAAGTDSNPFGGSSGVTYEGEMLLAYRGELYKLQGNFQLVTSDKGHDATGSGAPFALGSLAETWRMDSPRKRVIAALEAAAAGNAGVAPPFDVVVVHKQR